MAPFSYIYNHKNIIRKYGDIMTSLNYTTTHSVDSIVKSCLDISNLHIHFFSEPYDEKTNGISYKVFQTTINFLS